MVAGEYFGSRSIPSKLISTLVVFLQFLFITTQPAPVSADGFRNPFQSAAAIAQGNAFAAQADDASAVFYNPAGMTQLRGIQHVGGVEFVNVDTHFRGLNGRTTENDLGGPFGFPPPLQAFFTATPKDLNISWLGDLTVGFGLQNLFGFAARYPKDGPLNTAVIDLAYQIFLLETPKVLKNPNTAVNGTYRSTNQALAVSLRVGF